MYTRCPGCHTVHPINAALLAGGAGRYRCGKCNKLSNALESLFDEWPDAGAPATVPGDPPLLGLSLDLSSGAATRQALADDAGDPQDDTSAAIRASGRGRIVRAASALAAIAILVLIAFQVAEFRGMALPEQPGSGTALLRPDPRNAPADGTFRDPDSIHLVSRELTNHPTLPGHLQLSATIVNRAPQSQPFPEIEVSLLDAGGQAVSSERFVPADYLAAGTPAGAGMAPQAYLPLTLDLQDPGEQAVGFELRFR